MSANIKGYRYEIDGLRGFAVIAVIIDHFNNNFLPGGFLGVDIFFVISGFVITSSFARGTRKKLWELTTSFYSRRIKRLIPALLFFVLFSSLFICFVNPQPKTSLLTGLTSLIGLSNIYLINESTNYFADSTKLNIFLHTWSLSVEEQFYFLFPFFIWISGYSKENLNNGKIFFIYF